MSSVNPLVSVVVPNYNYADYLAPRIDSILRQTFSDFELLLLDDCSTDHSVSVMKKYASDPRVVAIDVNQTNTGSPFPQWMKGIKMARGKYVWIAEADDLAEPDFLSTLVAAAESHPDLAFCMPAPFSLTQPAKSLRVTSTTGGAAPRSLTPASMGNSMLSEISIGRVMWSMPVGHFSVVTKRCSCRIPPSFRCAIVATGFSGSAWLCLGMWLRSIKI